MILLLMWLVALGQGANTAWYASQPDAQSGVVWFDFFALGFCTVLAVCATVSDW